MQVSQLFSFINSLNESKSYSISDTKNKPTDPSKAFTAIPQSETDRSMDTKISSMDTDTSDTIDCNTGVDSCDSGIETHNFMSACSISDNTNMDSNRSNTSIVKPPEYIELLTNGASALIEREKKRVIEEEHDIAIRTYLNGLIDADNITDLEKRELELRPIDASAVYNLTTDQLNLRCIIGSKISPDIYGYSVYNFYTISNYCCRILSQEPNGMVRIFVNENQLLKQMIVDVKRLVRLVEYSADQIYNIKNTELPNLFLDPLGYKAIA